jgi:hypothetical protein
MATRPTGGKKEAGNSRKAQPQKNKSSAGAISVKRADKTSSRATVSGPARKVGAARIVDALTAKNAGAEAVAASFPFNTAKPSEFGEGPPAAGQTVDPPHPMVAGSTLTETNARFHPARKDHAFRS